MYRRDISHTLEKRLTEPRRFMQIVVGPRQTGKTTAVKQALRSGSFPLVHLDAERLMSLPETQIAIQWEQARQLAQREGTAVLFIDEIQRLRNWPNVVKALWDEDSWNDVPLHVVLSGSSTLLLRKGMNESLMGRFELIRSTQWALNEMRSAFGYDLNTYLRFGGYPGAAGLIAEPQRWQSFMAESIVESTIAKDVLLLETVKKPELLRRLYEMGSYYSGQEFSYRKILGQLDDRGNTETISHYLELLKGAGMLAGLQKFDNKEYRSRKSSPKFMVYDTSLLVTAWRDLCDQLFSDASLFGRLAESAVGAHLLNRSSKEGFKVGWWRDGNDEVDFVIRKDERISAIEVKSGSPKDLGGLARFMKEFPQAKPLVVNDSAGNTLEGFLADEIALF